MLSVLHKKKQKKYDHSEIRAVVKIVSEKEKNALFTERDPELSCAET